jgi:hypothetical protein
MSHTRHLHGIWFIPDQKDKKRLVSINPYCRFYPKNLNPNFQAQTDIPQFKCINFKRPTAQKIDLAAESRDG